MDQLELFIIHWKRLEGFRNYQDLNLVAQMVEFGKHIVFLLVYCLIELAFILLVAMTSVERVFSTMKIIKTELCNKMSWLFLRLIQDVLA
jgi:hypothetical protein